MSNITGKRRDLVPSKPAAGNSDMESDNSDSDDDDEDEDEELGGSGSPSLQLRKVAHEGCVNRIRAMAQNPHICASWADNGYVQVWDFRSHLNALAESETQGAQGASLVKFEHKDEGYAIDWNPIVPGRLVSGDCKNCIYLWEPTSDEAWNVDTKPFIGHTASVEDLQWSPTEPHVFASCSVAGTIAIWDVRLGKSAAASFKAHNADVNVISWNRLASCMLASGSDDGTFSIRGLRLVKEGDSVVAHFEYHKHPITSFEWSLLWLFSSSDNQPRWERMRTSETPKRRHDFRGFGLCFKSRCQRHVDGSIDCLIVDGSHFREPVEEKNEKVGCFVVCSPLSLFESEKKKRKATLIRVWISSSNTGVRHSM